MDTYAYVITYYSKKTCMQACNTRALKQRGTLTYRWCTHPYVYARVTASVVIVYTLPPTCMHACMHDGIYACNMHACWATLTGPSEHFGINIRSRWMAFVITKYYQFHSFLVHLVLCRCRKENEWRRNWIIPWSFSLIVRILEAWSVSS